MAEWLARLGRSGLAFFQRLGRGHLFLLQILAGLPGLLLRPWKRSAGLIQARNSSEPRSSAWRAWRLAMVMNIASPRSVC